jgi:hypothetical protein
MQDKLARRIRSVDRAVQLRIWQINIKREPSVYWPGREANRNLTVTHRSVV